MPIENKWRRHSCLRTKSLQAQLCERQHKPQNAVSQYQNGVGGKLHGN